MDRIDRFILNELTENGRKSFRQIANQLKVTSTLVKERYEKMRKEGIIVRPVTIIDLSKIGYQGKAYLLITKKPDYNKKEVISALRKVQNVYLVAEIVGEFDILAMAPFKDFNSITKLVNEVRSLSGLSCVDIALTSDTSFPITKYYSKVALPKIDQ